MAQTYSNLTPRLPVDATIGATTYIVKSFKADTSSTEVSFTNTNGSPRGIYLFRNRDTAAMQIECENADEAKPETLTTFSYGPSGSAALWVINGVSDSIASATPATWDLTLLCVSGSVIT